VYDKFHSLINTIREVMRVLCVFRASVACQPNHPGGMTNMKVKEYWEYCG